jgi:hypothetical protein
MARGLTLKCQIKEERLCQKKSTLACLSDSIVDEVNKKFYNIDPLVSVILRGYKLGYEVCIATGFILTLSGIFHCESLSSAKWFVPLFHSNGLP